MDKLEIAVHALRLIRDGKNPNPEDDKDPASLPVNGIEAQRIAQSALILMDFSDA